MRHLVNLMVVAWLFFCIGCAYTVTPKPEPERIYNPFVRKYPYKAAWVFDDKFKRTYYDITIQSDTASHQFVPALEQALKGSLKNAFAEVVEVSVVFDKYFDENKIDIAFYPKVIDYNVRLPETPGMLGEYTSFLVLDIDIYDWQGNAIDTFRVRGEGRRNGTTKPQSPWGYSKAVKSGEYDPDQHQFAHNQWQVSSRAIEDCCSKLLEQIKVSPSIQQYLAWLEQAKAQMAQAKEKEAEKQASPAAQPVESTGTKDTPKAPPPPPKEESGGTGIQ